MHASIMYASSIPELSPMGKKHSKSRNIP